MPHPAEMKDPAPPPPRLGLRENIGQFSLLVLVNAFVGGMVGMERSILPAVAEEEFGLAARTAILSFIVVFGVTKAAANYFAGRWSDRFGRRQVLIAGWLVATPVPFLLMWGPSWSWIVAANAFLGVSQGLTWSTTVIMKIDLAGPRDRGLAMGLNEFAGYLAVALSALATGWIAAEVGLRPEPFYPGVVFVALGLGLSVAVVRETRGHVRVEGARRGGDASTSRRAARSTAPSGREIFLDTSVRDRDLSSISQAGLVNNLNDGVAWGLFPLLFAAAGLTLTEIGTLASIYPAVWGAGQLVTGAWSDRIGRKGLIVSGMWTQALGILVVGAGSGFTAYAAGSTLLGLGTAMVYPTLLAAIGDVADPSWRGLRRRRLPPLERPRIRRGCRARRGPRGSVGAPDGDARRRRPDLPFGHHGRASHAGDALPRVKRGHRTSPLSRTRRPFERRIAPGARRRSPRCRPEPRRAPRTRRGRRKRRAPSMRSSAESVGDGRGGAAPRDS